MITNSKWNYSYLWLLSNLGTRPSLTDSNPPAQNNEILVLVVVFSVSTMSEYVAEGILPVIPDDLTVPQFILDSSHSTRPIRKQDIPWLVDDTTGRRIGFEEVSDRLPVMKYEFECQSIDV